MTAADTTREAEIEARAYFEAYLVHGRSSVTDKHAAALIAALDEARLRTAPDATLLREADAAVARLGSRKNEDVHKWAEELAKDLVAAGEVEYAATPDDADIVKRIRACTTEERAIAIFRHYRRSAAPDASDLDARDLERAEAIVTDWETYGGTQPPDKCVEPERTFLVNAIATALAEVRGEERSRILPVLADVHRAAVEQCAQIADLVAEEEQAQRDDALTAHNPKGALTRARQCQTACEIAATIRAFSPTAKEPKT